MHSPILCGPAAARWYLHFFHDPIACMREAHRSLGSLHAFASVFPRARGHLNVLAMAPEFNRAVLGGPNHFRGSGPILKGPPGSAQSRLRHGLTRMNGDAHQEQRRLLTPLLQKKMVDDYIPKMVALTNSTIRKWRNGDVVDIHQEMRCLSLLLSSEILLGSENPETFFSLGRMIEQIMGYSYSAGTLLLPVNLPGTPYRRMLKHSERLERRIARIAEIRRSEGNRGTDILSQIIRVHDEKYGPNGGANTGEYLLGQCAVLLSASYETTANALTWTLFLLSQHPRVMNELLDELEGTLRAGPPSADSLERMPFLDAVIKESLRVLPPVPYTIRATLQPYELGTLALKKGDRVVLGHYVVHHLPELYEEPERFRPERWSRINPDPYEYLPFSAGPRMCIGYAFAMTTMKVALATILPRFRLNVLPGTRVDRAVKVTLKPRHGLPMSIHSQDRRFESVAVRGNIHEMVNLR